jgi:hypothetical protein
MLCRRLRSSPVARTASLSVAIAILAAPSDLLYRPEVRELLADTDRVSHSVERFAGVAEDLPATVARERQAIIDQFSNVLVAQEATLPMLVEYLALRIAALIAVLIGGTLAATLTYRSLAVRMKT